MGVVRHLHFAVRQLHAHPALTAAVVLTLGLGIGANTAIFSFVNALLIQPFPFRDADQLVEIHSLRGGQPGKLSMREVLDIRERVGVVEAVAAHTGSGGGYNYGGEGPPEEWRAILTTGNLFEVLGVALEQGRPWPAQADRERDFRVILSHAVWRRVALDAAPRAVRDLVAFRGVALGTGGLCLGAAGAVGAGHILEKAFPPVPAFDGLSLAGSMLALGGVIVLASLLPAWRAARTGPAAVLRQE
jgi:MacB-like periplasmic core domain